MSATSKATRLPDGKLLSWVTGDCLGDRPADAHGNIDPDQTCCAVHSMPIYRHVIEDGPVSNYCAHVLNINAACDCGAAGPNAEPPKPTSLLDAGVPCEVDDRGVCMVPRHAELHGESG